MSRYSPVDQQLCEGDRFQKDPQDGGCRKYQDKIGCLPKQKSAGLNKQYDYYREYV